MPALPAALPWSFGRWIPPDSLLAIDGTALAWIESYCDDAISLLLNQFRDKPRLKDVLCSLVAGVEDIDDVTYQLLVERSVSTAVGVQLDRLGEILNLPRQGWVDETYRALLGAQVLVLGSEVTAAHMRAILVVIGGVGILQYRDEPASLRIVLGEPLPDVDIDTAFDLLRRAKAAGIRLDFEEPTVAASLSFTWADADDSQADTLRGWADDAATYGGYWADVRSTED